MALKNGARAKIGRADSGRPRGAIGAARPLGACELLMDSAAGRPCSLERKVLLPVFVVFAKLARARRVSQGPIGNDSIVRGASLIIIQFAAAQKTAAARPPPSGAQLCSGAANYRRRRKCDLPNARAQVRVADKWPAGRPAGAARNEKWPTQISCCPLGRQNNQIE